MSSTTITGSVYGSAVYGVNEYGQSNIVHTPDGVFSSLLVGLIGPRADANFEVSGQVSFSELGSVLVFGGSTVTAVSQQIDSEYGDAIASAGANTPVSGLALSSDAGSVNLFGGATVVPVSQLVDSFAGDITVSGEAVFDVTGVSSLVFISPTSIFAGATATPTGLLAESDSGLFDITTTQFNYVAEDYDRSKVSYVDDYPARVVYIQA
jgi:hypothetical protein